MADCPVRWAASLFCFVVHFLLARFLFPVSIFLILAIASDFSFGGLSSPTLATALGAPTRGGVRERLAVCQHLVAA